MIRMLVLSACLSVAACGDIMSDTAVEQVPAPAPAVSAPESELADAPRAGLAPAEIDWTTARTDLASTPASARSVGTAQAFQIQSGGDAPPVPVLLPTGIVSVQRAGAAPAFRPQEDGYFARYPGVAYDITVHGTNMIAAVPGTGITRETEPVFAAMMDGAQVSLSRYGADYLVAFQCHGAAIIEPCISEEEALAVARNLVIVGTR